jgi:hypothetical protein
MASRSQVNGARMTISARFGDDRSGAGTIVAWASKILDLRVAEPSLPRHRRKLSGPPIGRGEMSLAFGDHRT